MPLDCRKDFPLARELAYLDTAAEGLPVPGCAEAYDEYCRDKARGTPGRRRYHAVEAETVETIARWLGAEPASIVLLSSASEALSTLAGSLDFRAGDEVILSDLEFPSNVIPWLRLKQAGVVTTVVRSTGGALRMEDVVNRLSSRTRLVSLSLVSYKTGAYLPFVPQLAAEVHRAGGVLAIDATQALGRLPVSLEGIDYLMSSSFKWLLGPHGLGIVYVAPHLWERLDPRAVGWYSVPNSFSPDRFERYELKPGAARLAAGMPNFGSMYALRASLRYVCGVGPAAIDRELRPVVSGLGESLAGMGLELLTPAAPEYASGIVAFAHSAAERIGAELERRGVIVWAGDGRVRAALHLYNDADDTARYLEALRAVLAEVVHA